MIMLYLIVLAITATVIVNTLIMAVFERTREIGILSAIGMKGGRIMAMFFAESSLLAVGGIVMGLVLGGLLVSLRRHRYGFYIGNYGHRPASCIGERIYAYLTLERYRHPDHHWPLSSPCWRRSTRRCWPPAWNPSKPCTAGSKSNYEKEINNMEVTKIENVTRVFKIGKVETQALRGVSLSIESGEFTALVGPSGSGKTTLLQLIGCLDQPTSGQVFINGKDVSRLNRNQRADMRRGTIGFIFQFFALIPTLTAYENVEMPLLLTGQSAAERRERVTELLEAVDLTDRAHHRPDQLSGGRAAARGHRPRPGHQTGAHPGRRADRQPGYAQRQAGDGDHDPPQPGDRRHLCLCHPRPARDQVRPAGGHPARWPDHRRGCRRRGKPIGSHAHAFQTSVRNVNGCRPARRRARDELRRAAPATPTANLPPTV